MANVRTDFSDQSYVFELGSIDGGHCVEDICIRRDLKWHLREMVSVGRGWRPSMNPWLGCVVPKEAHMLGFDCLREAAGGLMC